MLAGVVDLKRAGNVAFFTWQAQRFRILEQDVGDCLRSKTSNFWRARCLRCRNHLLWTSSFFGLAAHGCVAMFRADPPTLIFLKET